MTVGGRRYKAVGLLYFLQSDIKTGHVSQGFYFSLWLKVFCVRNEHLQVFQVHDFIES